MVEVRIQMMGANGQFLPGEAVVFCATGTPVSQPFRRGLEFFVFDDVSLFNTPILLLYYKDDLTHKKQRLPDPTMPLTNPCTIVGKVLQ